MQCVVTYGTDTYSQLRSVLRYKFLILDMYHLDTLYLCEQECEDPWLFFDTRRGSQSQKFGKHSSRLL
jgi:hypothetical protein